jgi:hypothetical protein
LIQAISAGWNIGEALKSSDETRCGYQKFHRERNLSSIEHC